MGYSRPVAALSGDIGLLVAGIAGAVAWHQGLWGLLTGAILLAGALCARRWLMADERHVASRVPAPEAADADGAVLRMLLDAAPTPLVTVEGGAARALNRAARRLFATDDRILPLPAALADTGATHLRHEGRGWRIDRVVVAGGAGRTVAALIDIDQEERTAEARATAEMIQILGHELLNGLAPIASLAESGVAAVARTDTDPALLREILGTLARRTEGLQRFAGAYRALARLPAPRPAPTRLAELADDLARLFAGRWPGRTLTVVTADIAWPLDRDQIAQALWALVQNAVEAGGSEVRLRMRTVEGGLAIEVEDDGPGIAASDVGRIFRPFHTTRPEGTGVGLSLARQIALAHGGTLTLEPGGATVFRLFLPAGTSPAAAAAAAGDVHDRAVDPVG